MLQRPAPISPEPTRPARPAPPPAPTSFYPTSVYNLHLKYVVVDMPPIKERNVQHFRKEFKDRGLSAFNISIVSDDYVELVLKEQQLDAWNQSSYTFLPSLNLEDEGPALVRRIKHELQCATANNSRLRQFFQTWLSALEEQSTPPFSP